MPGGDRVTVYERCERTLTRQLDGWTCHERPWGPEWTFASTSGHWSIGLGTDDISVTGSVDTAYESGEIDGTLSLADAANLTADELIDTLDAMLEEVVAS